MATTDEGVLEVYVQPGECPLVKEPAMICTVLGSCVGITFHVPRLGIGALCHPMLPTCPVNRLVTMSESAKCRYVDFTIRAMARRLDSLRVRRGEIEVKLFGGADVLTVSKNATRPSVGRLNCEAAMRVLEEEGFEVAASSLGGKQGVHIRFQTVTGEVQLRRLDCIPSLDQAVSGEETESVSNHAVRNRR